MEDGVEDGAAGGAGRAVELVVDVANAVGSRPDGWWRDRAGASTRLLAQLARLARLGEAGAVEGPGGVPLRVGTVHAVLEGRARSAAVPSGPAGAEPGERLRVVLAPQDGDSAVVELVGRLVLAQQAVLVVTADRGLRDRLPGGVRTTGPGWLRDLLDALEREELPAEEWVRRAGKRLSARGRS